MESPYSLLLSDPDITTTELAAVEAALKSPRLSAGPLTDAFEAAFAQSLQRHYAIATGSATVGLAMILKASGIGPGDEVITAAFSFREIAHGIALAGATPVFVDVDYWSGTLAPEKVEARIGTHTRAVLVGNTNGHPAAWQAFRDLADKHKLLLIEDSTEAIGSLYKGKPVGSFGDCALFSLAQPGPLVCGEGAVMVTDDLDLASRVRGYRARRTDERRSVVLGDLVPMQVPFADFNAALAMVQLKRLQEILARRKMVEGFYAGFMQSFEGIKPPYIAPDSDTVHWFLYVVHLGTRFSRSSRDAIMQDLATEKIEAVAYCHPLHLQGHYRRADIDKKDLFVTEKLADRAIALPFHGHLTEDQVGFTVQTAKDASINIGAGAAIYL